MKNDLQTLAILGGKAIRDEQMPPRHALGELEIEQIKRVIEYYGTRNEDPPYQGHFEQEFCAAFSEFMGGGYSDAVSTGTAAVYVALAALELPSNSEVIISPVTDSGPLNCIILQGYIPVVADSAPDSYNIDTEQFLKRISPKTSALLAVHSAGEPLEIDKITYEAHKRGIKVLEDCSQAIGALCQGKKVGSFGDIAAFSTMYRKALSAGASSGLVYCKDPEMYHRALAHADRGKPSWRKDIDLRNPGHALFPALNFNTDEFSCAVGIASLKRLQDTIDKRVCFLECFVNLLKKRSRVCRPYALDRNFSPFYFPVFVDQNLITCTKTEFAEALAAEGVGLGAHYGCVISSWDYAKSYLSDDVQSKNALNTRDRSFNLYLNENYGEKEADDITKAIVKVEKHFYKGEQSNSNRSLCK